MRNEQPAGFLGRLCDITAEEALCAAIVLMLSAAIVGIGLDVAPKSWSQ